MTVIEQIAQTRLFKGLQQKELEKLAQLAQPLTFDANAEIIKEGERGFEFYLLLSGKAEVIKKSEGGGSHSLKTFEEGDTFGELAFIEDGLRTATIRTTGEVKVLRFDGDAIRSDPNNTSLRIHVVATMAKLLSERLSYTNRVTVKSMQESLDKTKEQVALGFILVAVLFLAASYEFALGFVLSFKEFFATTTPISVAMIVVYALVLFVAIWRGGFPLSSYGLTLKNGGWVAAKAILYSLPVMGAILVLKWVLIKSFAEFQDYALFQPYTVFKTPEPPTASAYALIVLAYALFSPIQEFIVRGALQSSLQMFLKRNSNLWVWMAIVLSNLVFASSHMHTSYKFALLAFIPGLFWGWMFHKQRSLIGVSVSHILIGVWVSFIVGWPGLV